MFRAVRKGVQDAAVKLLTNVETAQLSVFLNVRPPPGHWVRISPTDVHVAHAALGLWVQWDHLRDVGACLAYQSLQAWMRAQRAKAARS